jgi:hypothetical protein
MKTYRSKIGLELVIPLAIILGGVGILFAFEKIWIGFWLLMACFAFVAHMFFTTKYGVGNNQLRVKCSFFVDIVNPINTITQIKETRNPISSPAMSLDRLLILYNKHDAVIISPKEKDVFLNQLMMVNPLIKVLLKKK